MSSSEGMKLVPADLGVQILQAIVDLMGLPDVTVTFDPYPSFIFARDVPGWAQHTAMQVDGYQTQGQYVFRQPVHFSQEPEAQHEERWPEFYLVGFLARDRVDVPGSLLPQRNDQVLMAHLRERFVRCRHVPTFESGDPVPGFTCCGKPLACERDAAPQLAGGDSTA